jgi:hypothetical protein
VKTTDLVEGFGEHLADDGELLPVQGDALGKTSSDPAVKTVPVEGDGGAAGPKRLVIGRRQAQCHGLARARIERCGKHAQGGVDELCGSNGVIAVDATRDLGGELDGFHG